MRLKNPVAKMKPEVKPIVFSENMKKVKISSLTMAAHNPKTRTTINSNKMRQLMRSIEEDGLIYPIAVSADMTIVDGHRRFVACKALGWDTIPVIIIPNKNVNAVYAGVNSNAEIMSGLQVLQVYLVEPEAISAKTRIVLERYSEEFGRAILKALVKARLSWHTLASAKRMARYTEDESAEFLDKSVKYLIEHRNVRTVKNYMTLKQSPSKLWDIVNKNRAIEVAFA